MAAPSARLRTLLHAEVDAPDTEAVRALVDRMEATLVARRAHGRGTWLPDGTWIDTDADLQGVADQTLGALLRRGPVRRDVVAQVHGVVAEANAAIHDRGTRWQALCTARVMGALVRVQGLSEAVRVRLASTDPDGIVDTRDLPTDLAADVLAQLDDAPTVRVLVGDNRQVLRVLAAEGVVLDAVLEDPPYDSRSPDLTYDDSFPPGAWTALLREHLLGVRDVLAPHGQVVIHIDEHRGAELHRLMGEVFGIGHLGTVVWDKRNPKGDARGIAVQHERIEWAVRDVDALWARGGLRRPKAHAAGMLAMAASLTDTHGVPEARPLWRAWLRSQPGLSGGERAYRELDDHGRPYRKVSMAWPNKRRPPEAYFEALRHPVTDEPCPVPQRGWRYPPETMRRLLQEGRILFGRDHRIQPTRCLRLDEVLSEPVPSVLYHAGSDDARLAAMGLAFPFSKPVAVIQRLLASAAPRPHMLVADLFAGSGSTAEAVLLDAVAGLPRRVVLAERERATVDGVLLPRLRAVLTGPAAGLSAWVRIDELVAPGSGPA